MASKKWKELRAISYQFSGFLTAIAAVWALQDPAGKGIYAGGLIIVSSLVTWLAHYVIPENGNGDGSVKSA